MMSSTGSAEDSASSSALSVGSSSLDSSASTSNSPRLPDLIPSTSSHRSSTSTVASTSSSNVSNRTGWMQSASPGIVSADELSNAKSAPPSALSNLPSFSRPEPLRAYEPHLLGSPPTEVQLTTPDSETLSEETVLQTPLDTASLERLQQAANYANFASSGSTSDPGDVIIPSATLAAATVGTFNGDISPSSEILAAAAANNSVATQAVLAGYAARRPLDPTIFEHEQPPRLSTSSAESSVSSDILTPESGSRIHTWDHVEGGDNVADVTRQSTLRARPLTLHRLPSSTKTDTTLRASPPTTHSNISSANQSPAAAQLPNPLEESSAVTSHPRFKVPGAPASRRPSSSKSRSANGSDDCVPTMSKLRLASSPEPNSPCDSVESESSSFFAGRTGDARGRTASTPSSAFRPPIASPDSWRSLLPEHDPFFIPNDGTASVTSASSPRGTGSQLGDAFGAPTSAAAKRESGSSGWGQSGGPLADSRRLSSGSQASQQSSFSLPGPVAALSSGRMATSPSWPDRESWRSLLPENDAGARPTSAGEYVLSASPASPSSPLAEGSRGAFGVLDRFGPGGYAYGDPASAAAARRHCSFSTYDRMVQDGVYGSLRGGVTSSLASGSTSASHSHSTGHLPHGVNSNAPHSPFIHPPSPNVNDAAAFMSRGAQSFRAPTTNLVEAAKALTASASTESTRSRPQPITRASGGMKDAEERESWPCSRSLSSFPTTQVGEAADEEQLSRILSDGLRGGLNSQTTLVDRTQGPLGDSALLTQTTTTTVTTTTTTKLTRVEGAEDDVVSQASSSPAFGGGAATAQCTRTLTRSMSQQEPASPYSVSPLSPPTLPFLDHRPAPPETNLTIETSPTRYTLITFLPGFSLDAITLATKHHRQLIIVADKWDEAGGGHFERKVTFSHDANLKKTTASFDGATLKVVIPRIARMHA